MVKRETEKIRPVTDAGAPNPGTIPTSQPDTEHQGVRDGRRTPGGTNYGDWRPGDDKKMGPQTDPKQVPPVDSGQSTK